MSARILVREDMVRDRGSPISHMDPACPTRAHLTAYKIADLRIEATRKGVDRKMLHVGSVARSRRTSEPETAHPMNYLA